MRRHALRRPGGTRALWGLALILILALVFRVWGITWGLHDANVSRRPHPDEWAIYWLFRWFDGTHSLNPCPTAKTQCFFDWGMPFPYLSYGLHFLLFPLITLIPAGSFGAHADLEFVRVVLAARIVSALVSTGTVVLVYWLASRAYGRAAGLLAALITALAGLLIQLAHFATPDSTTLFLMTASLVLMYRFLVMPSSGRFAAAGSAVGLAAGSEYHMALLVIPLVTAWFLGRRSSVGSLRRPPSQLGGNPLSPQLPLLKRERGGEASVGTRGTPPKIGYPWLLGTLGCSLLAWVAVNPYAVVEFPQFLSALEHAIRIHTVDSAAQYQGRWAPYGPAWLYVVRYPLGYGAGFALAAWLLAGFAWGAMRRHKTELLLLSWIIPYFLLVTFTPAKFMRYSAPLLLPLAILAAAWAAELSARFWNVRSRLALGAAACLVAAYTASYDAAYARLFAAPDPRSVAASWLASHATRGSDIAFEQIPDGLLNLPNFVTVLGYHPCFAQFQGQPLDGPMRYLLLDSYGMEEHPSASNSAVQRFLRQLATRSDYRLRLRITYTPTFLGLTFPIQGSPHDWRYPARVITIYQHVSSGDGDGSNCFRDLAQAQNALYVPPART